MIEVLKKFSIPIAILLSGLIIAGAFIFVNREKPEETQVPQEIAEEAVNFINQNKEGFGLTEDITVSLTSVTEESGLYKINLKINEQEFSSYVTKDGKILFPQGIALEQAPETGVEIPEDIEAGPERASLEVFAKCLDEKGMKFYGAFWCSWCAKQKELFGEAVQYLPYIECSDEETREMTPECEEAGIASFPTWGLPGGEKSPGFKTLEQLTELSGCEL